MPALVIMFDHDLVTSGREYPGQAQAKVELGPHGPLYVEHASIPGVGWLVWRILEAWTGDSWELRGTSAETDRYRLDVSGPAPWDRSPATRFTLVVRRYAHPRRGWWVSAEYPGTAAPDSPGAADARPGTRGPQARPGPPRGDGRGMT